MLIAESNITIIKLHWRNDHFTLESSCKHPRLPTAENDVVLMPDVLDTLGVSEAVERLLGDGDVKTAELGIDAALKIAREGEKRAKFFPQETETIVYVCVSVCTYVCIFHYARTVQDE